MAAKLSVPEALQQIQQAVRNGDFQQAAAIGASATIPLNLGPQEVSLGPELAQGAEGSVLLSTWRGQQVAVKRFKIAQSDDLTRFRRELSILSQLQHPHIMPLLGARTLPPDYYLVMPLARSSLYEQLHQQGWRPGLLAALHVAQQLADAVAYLHSKGWVHRDIKPNNVLEAAQGSSIWLTDFGLAVSAGDAVEAATVTQTALRARGKPTGGFHKRAMMGTLEYMAPEVLLKKPASFASDVYALAITINELATGVYPFSDCTKDNPEVHTVLEHGYGRQELAAAVASEGLRPTLPKGAPDSYKQLMAACWALDPEQRPSAAAVRDTVASLLYQLQQQQLKQAQAAAAAAAAAGGSGSSSPSVSAASSTTPLTLQMLQLAGGAWPQQQQSPGYAWHLQQQQLQQQHDEELAPASPQQQQQQLQQLQDHELGLDYVCSSEQSSMCPMDMDSPGWRTPLPTAASPERGPRVPLVPLADALSATAAACPAPEGLQVSAGVYAAMGPRNTMEDRYVVVRGLGGDPSLHFAAVFDGHRGLAAAHHAALHMPRALQVAAVKALQQGSNSSHHGSSRDSCAGGAGSSSSEVAVAAATAALKEAFLAVDEGFFREWQQEAHLQQALHSHSKQGCPGSTAIAAVIAGGMLLLANAGDSRAVLSRAGRAVPLSRQHTPELPDERARIEAAGGKVSLKGGSWRVGDAALQVTRALGDFDLKASDGVTAEPEVLQVPLTQDDQFIILASDGLWDVVSDQQAVGLVMDTVKDPSLCAKRLVQEAMTRSSQDNVSVVIIFLQPVTTAERVWARGTGAPLPEATDTFYGTRRKTIAQATGQLPPGQADVGSCTDEMQETY